MLEKLKGLFPAHILDWITKKIPGPQECINKMCKVCIYDQYQPKTWRAQVEDCTSPNCPLFLRRPVTLETIAARRQAKKALATIKS